METNPELKKMATKKVFLEILKKNIEDQLEDIEILMVPELRKNPQPGMAIKINKGQVRPSWKDHFVAKCIGAGQDPEFEVSMVVKNTNPGKDSFKLAIDESIYFPDLDSISKMMTFLETI